jgi:putative nucleotidyltransferase with HDIG domain
MPMPYLIVDIFELYRELDTHLMEDEAPSRFLRDASFLPEFNQFPFEMLHKLKKTEQSPLHHPEGNVWNHVLLVVDRASEVKHKSNDPRVFMWAALLHDIGKPDTTRLKNGRIVSYDHDKAGESLARKFLVFFEQDEAFVEKVAQLVRYHMHPLYLLNNLPFADIPGIKSKTNITEVALLGYCDRTGRKDSDFRKEEQNMDLFLRKLDNAKGLKSRNNDSH